MRYDRKTLVKFSAVLALVIIAIGLLSGNFIFTAIGGGFLVFSYYMVKIKSASAIKPGGA